jgi:MFS family permease
MLVGRSLQGVGGGGIISLTEIIVTDLVPLRFRGAWFGYLSSMWAVGSVSGPLIGGALAQNGAWVSDNTHLGCAGHKLTIYRDGSST